MFKAYVSQVKTLKTTGDVTGAIEIACAENKELKQQVMDVDHETVVVLTLKEFNTYLEVLGDAQLEKDIVDAKEEVNIKDDFGTECTGE